MKRLKIGNTRYYRMASKEVQTKLYELKKEVEEYTSVDESAEN